MANRRPLHVVHGGADVVPMTSSCHGLRFRSNEHHRPHGSERSSKGDVMADEIRQSFFAPAAVTPHDVSSRQTAFRPHANLIALEKWNGGRRMISIKGAVLMAGLMAMILPSGSRAQDHPPCPPAPALEASTISVDTKTAADLATKLLGRLGIDIDVHTTRDSVLKDNPRADQTITVLTMMHIYCEMIWSDTKLSGAEKAVRFQAAMEALVRPAAGPAPIAKTSGAAHGRVLRARAPIEVASTDDLGFLLLAQNDKQIPVPNPQTGFLRDPPFYVTDANKYFVIVGSSDTEEEGRQLMEKLKAKAPKYDFALYGPYGANTHYGIMMASWVPKEIAQEALRIAHQEVAKDAYLWACRSTGESC